MDRVPIITRTPIRGERTPIVLNLREPIHMNDPLNWDDVFAQYDNYVKFAAKQISEQNPGRMLTSAEDMYQDGLVLLWKCYEQYKYKPMSEFGYIFKASVWRLLRGIAAKIEPATDDLDTAFDVGVEDDTWDEMWEEYRIKQVIELLEGYPVAIQLLKEFISHSPGSLKECEQDMARKEMVKSLGKRVNVPTTLEIKGVHIQRALDLSKSIYNQNLRRLQQAVYQVYSPDTVIHNYTPAADDLASMFQDDTPVRGVMVDVLPLGTTGFNQLVSSLTEQLMEAQEDTVEAPMETNVG